MNKLSSDERARILHLLCEGMSIRAITRLTGASKNTVAKLLADAGRACAIYQDQAFRELPCTRIQVDEIWSFVYAKAKNVETAKAAPEGAGDVWTWTALCADTKLLLSWLVGGRDAEYATVFMHDIRGRLLERPQITSDGHYAYLSAVDEAFGKEVNYAQIIKTYGESADSTRRYSPPICTGVKKRTVTGNPDKDHVSTSFVERQNLTMRMHMRRFTRLTNGFSKKVENHVHAVALHAMYYNFVKEQRGIRMTPAMKAGVTDTLWTIDHIVRVVELFDVKPGKRGPYKKRGQEPSEADQNQSS